MSQRPLARAALAACSALLLVGTAHAKLEPYPGAPPVHDHGGHDHGEEPRGAGPRGIGVGGDRDDDRGLGNGNYGGDDPGDHDHGDGDDDHHHGEEATYGQQLHPWCGTTPWRFEESLAVHQENRIRLEQDHGPAEMRAAPMAVKVGDIAVLVDDGSIVVQPNALDIDNIGVQYTPGKKGGYTAAAFTGGISEDVGNAVSLSDDDAVRIDFPKAFRFSYYGRQYKNMFVHSDGNITFGQPDASSFERNLARLLSGPARIAPLFSDLNPETVTAEGGGVFVAMSNSRVVITWRDVPTFGRADRNSAQITLYSNGRITVAYGELGATQGVAGISPGGGARAQIVDWTASLPVTVNNNTIAIAERYQTTRQVDDLATAQAFFREFADDYDHLVVWFDFSHSLGQGAFAYEFTVRNDIKGIGEGTYDNSAAAGSKSRLRSFVQMGTLARYPRDPHQTFLGTNSTLDILGQETGHRWGTYLRFRDADGNNSDALLGRDLAHWSFCHDTQGSDLEGNHLSDLGGRFETVDATSRFSPLDQYLMGLIPASQVPDFFYVAGCPFDPAKAPQIGLAFQGERVDVSIQQVIAAVGPRVPDSRTAPKKFNMAFILITDGSAPSEDSLAHLETIRSEWEAYWAQATDGNGAVDTTIKPRTGRR